MPMKLHEVGWFLQIYFCLLHKKSLHTYIEYLMDIMSFKTFLQLEHESTIECNNMCRSEDACSLH